MECEIGDSGASSFAMSFVERNPIISPGQIITAGMPEFWLYDKYGRLKFHEKVKNGVTQQGTIYMIGCAFPASGPTPAQISSWYIGLINNTGSPTLASTDTHGTHSGWSELSASGNFSDSTRPQWNITSGTVNSTTYSATTNGSSTSDYHFIGSCSIFGVFLTNMATLGSSDSTKLLISTAAFTSPQSVNNGDILKSSYTMQMTLT